ncbi:MAG: EamA family transporter RarD [Parasphingopyxis sp.]|uniref:EamA family transporter RarD n=1 Tax=Parasphingopyxis sp. TaxID=1920299 RepID=UPI0032EC8997
MERQGNSRAGYAFGVGVYLVWGLVPIYFKLLDHVGAIEIVAHRIIWSVPFLLLLLALIGRIGHLRAAMLNGRLIGTLAVSAVLIAINWLVYIYAVTTEHIVAASLGYFLNPFVNIALGTLLLGERLRPAAKVAIFVAAVGVSILAVSALDTLWISLTLACSFGLYGYVRKVTEVGAIEGLAVETGILAPLFVIYLIWLAGNGGLDFARFGAPTVGLLLGAALVTSIPLMLFAAAARRLTLTTLGFIQYLAPSLAFIIGVVIYDEPLNWGQIVCFGLIWTAIAIFVADNYRAARKRRAVRTAPV